jgi:hypothetical protein
LLDAAAKTVGLDGFLERIFQTRAAERIGNEKRA